LDLANSLALQNSTLTTGGTGLVFDQSVSDHAFTFGGLSGSTNLALTDNGGNPVTLTLVNPNNTYSGVLSGAGGLVKSGTGTLILTARSSFTGAITVANGILSVSANGALGATNALGVTVSNGATLQINSINDSVAEDLMINGYGFGEGGALVATGSGSYRGAIRVQTNASVGVVGGDSLELDGGVTKDGTILTIAGGGTVIINSVGISGTSANSDLVVDASTLILNTSNSYNGPTTVQDGGTLRIGVSNVLPAGTATALTLTGGGILDLLGNSDTVASLMMSGGQVIGTGGVINSEGAVTANGANNVIGSGATVALTGTAAVNGSILVHGAIAGAVIVNSGGTLSGDGSVGALTVSTGAVLAPGNSTTGIGTLTTGNLTLQNNITLSLAITRNASGTAGVNYTQLSAHALNLTGIASIHVTLQNVLGDGSTFNPNSDHLWTSVITTTGLTGFNPSQFVIDPGNFFGGYFPGSFSMVQDQLHVNNLDLQYLAVPEPQTWALLLGGVGLLGLARRRRAQG